MALTTKLPEKYEDLDKPKRQIAEAILDNLNRGATMRDACKEAGGSDVTFYRWRCRYPWLEESVQAIVGARLQVVEDALFKSATGYDYEVTEQRVEEVVDDSGTRVGHQRRHMSKRKVHVPPVPTAAIFYLKNRSGGRWRNDHSIKIESTHTERHEMALTAEVRQIVQAASTEDLRMLAEMGDRITQEVEARQIPDSDA